MLDLILMPHVHAYRVHDLTSRRNIAFKSHHFLVTARLDVDLESCGKQSHMQQNISILLNEDVKQQFVETVSAVFQHKPSIVPTQIRQEVRRLEPVFQHNSDTHSRGVSMLGATFSTQILAISGQLS